MMITTQQIPAMLALWEKNREKKVFARQKAGKIGSSWGNAFRSKVGTLELRSTCVQSNRLPATRCFLTTVEKLVELHGSGISSRK